MESSKLSLKEKIKAQIEFEGWRLEKEKEKMDIVSQENQPIKPAEKYTGRVKWFNKTYGFIRRIDGVDFFVHYSGILGEQKFKILREEDLVEFEVGEGKDGRAKAINVVILPQSPRELSEQTETQEELYGTEK